MQISGTPGETLSLPTAAAIPASNTRFRVLSLLIVLASLTYIDRLCISVAAPFIVDEFKFSPLQMGYIFSAFTFAYAVFEIPSGWFGDYFGTRKALTRIVLWWSSFTMLTAATRGFTSLFIVRLLFGAGEAGAIPNSASTVSRWFPASQRGRAMGGVCMGHAIGAAATPPIVFKLIELQGWRLPFIEFGALGFIWCFVWYWWYRDAPEKHASVNEEEIKIIRGGLPIVQGHSHRIPWRAFIKSKNIF